MLLEDKYIAMANRLMSAIKSRNKDAVRVLLEEAMTALSSSQFEVLKSIYESELRKNGKRVVVPFKIWKERIEDICNILHDSRIKDTLNPPKTLSIHKELEFIEIYTLGLTDDSPVFITIYSISDELYNKIAGVLCD